MSLDHFRGVGRHDWVGGKRVGIRFGSFWMQLSFWQKFGSIQLKQIMQRLAVLAYIELLQRAALICYCSALKNLASVSDVMH